MSLKPESLRPMDIVALYPKLTDKEGTEALVIVHAAIEELQATSDQLVGPLRDQQRMLSAEDETGLIELVTDLRDLFEHLSGHCSEAAAALWGLTESLASQQSDGRAPGRKSTES